MNLRLYIDYDNLRMHLKRAGVLDVTTKALLSTPLPTSRTTGRCDVRIYGGWYEGTALTPLAQDIIAEIGRDFPAVLPFNNHTQPAKLLVTAELACSLECEPSHHLFNTLRQRSTPRTLKCTAPSSKGCSELECPLVCLTPLFDSGRCPKNGCAILMQDVIYRREQKLVDSMLTCDMLHAARLGCDFIMLVSSDDDLLPAVRVALLTGIPCARLHPQLYHQLASFPSGGASFVEANL